MPHKITSILAAVLDAAPLILGSALLGLAFWTVGALFGYGSIINR